MHQIPECLGENQTISISMQIQYVNYIISVKKPRTWLSQQLVATLMGVLDGK